MKINNKLEKLYSKIKKNRINEIYTEVFSLKKLKEGTRAQQIAETKKYKRLEGNKFKLALKAKKLEKWVNVKMDKKVSGICKEFNAKYGN